MRRRSREISIFSISALDLFASAMGAFIIIAVVLFPYYLMRSPETPEQIRQLEQAKQQCDGELTQTRTELNRANQRLDTTQRQLDDTNQLLQSSRQQLQSAQQELSDNREQQQSCAQLLQQNFIAVVIQWQTENHDVDLHIVDPSGARFSFEHKRISGRPGELSADTKIGPGVEIWEISQPPVGRYQVFYHLYDQHENLHPAVVQGGVYHRDGHYRLPSISLSYRNQMEPIATIEMHSDGKVTISGVEH